MQSACPTSGRVASGGVGVMTTTHVDAHVVRPASAGLACPAAVFSDATRREAVDPTRDPGTRLQTSDGCTPRDAAGREHPTTSKVAVVGTLGHRLEGPHPGGEAALILS